MDIFYSAVKYDLDKLGSQSNNPKRKNFKRDRFLIAMDKKLKEKYDSMPCDPKYQLKSLFYFSKSQLLVEKLVIACSNINCTIQTQTNTLLLNPNESVIRINDNDFFSDNSECDKVQELENLSEQLSKDSLLEELNINGKFDNEMFFTEDVMKKINESDRISFSSSLYNMYEPNLSSARSSENSLIQQNPIVRNSNEKPSLICKNTAKKSQEPTALSTFLKKRIPTNLFTDYTREKIARKPLLTKNKSEIIINKKRLNSLTKNTTRRTKGSKSPISNSKRPKSKYKSQKSQTLATSSLYKSQSKSKSPLRQFSKQIEHLKEVLKGKSKNKESEGFPFVKHRKSRH